MTDDRLPLAELLQKAGDGDFLRSVAEAVLQLLMESDVEGLIGAARHERSAERMNWRNGYRERALDTRLGTLQLRVPKLRQGSYFPPFLEPRKVSEKALVAVIQEAWIGGVSTRRVDELVQAMGLGGISKSTVSKLCKDIDERVGAFLDRPLEGEWPYLWLDATYLRVRQGGRIVSVAAINRGGGRHRGAARDRRPGLGPSEAEPFWSTFLRGLLRAGLAGVRLVVSDAPRASRPRRLRSCHDCQRSPEGPLVDAQPPRTTLSTGPETVVAAALSPAFFQPDQTARGVVAAGGPAPSCAAARLAPGSRR
jgi:transposase-like protein